MSSQPSVTDILGEDILAEHQIHRVENPPRSRRSADRFDLVAKEAEFPDHSTSTPLF